MSFFPRAVSLAAVLLTAACTAVPVLSLVSLARIDARTTQLDRLRVAVRLPEAIQPRKTGVRLDAVVTMTGELGRTTTYNLEESRDAADLAGIAVGAPGMSTHVYRLPAAEIARFEAMRAEVFAASDAGRRGSLSLGIATKEFCRSMALPDGPVLVTTYLKTSETDGYVTVTADVDLRRQPETAGILAQLAPCEP